MDTTTTLPADLAAHYGPITAREFDDSADAHKPRLIEWLTRLPTLSDDEFRDVAASAIHGSALMNSFRGNWNHEHCRATAAYDEARRRHIAAGHDERCYGDNLYSQAFLIAWSGQGHDPFAYPVQPCTCGATP